MLPAGRYVARFTYRAAARQGGAGEPWGRFVLHDADAGLVISGIDIPPEPGAPDADRESQLAVTLSATTHVEPRVIGGAVEVWLDAVEFEPVE